MLQKRATFHALFTTIFQRKPTNTQKAHQSQSQPSRPHRDDRDGWRDYWQKMGQPWRTEPEIDAKRQRYLAERRAIVLDIERGIYPFKDLKLSRADVEWLRATHENGRGPVDWEDESQRERKGLDLRGTRLEHVDLKGLPLARLCGGLHRNEWLQASTEQCEAAAIHLERADMRLTHLEGADLHYAHFERVDLRSASLECVDLTKAHLQDADLNSTHFERADLSHAHLEGAYLSNAHFQQAHLIGTHLEAAVLSETHFEGTVLREVFSHVAGTRGGTRQRVLCPSAGAGGERATGGGLASSRPSGRLLRANPPVGGSDGHHERAGESLAVGMARAGNGRAHQPGHPCCLAGSQHIARGSASASGSRAEPLASMQPDE